MGYQRVVKPIFYVDMMSYLHAIGHSQYFNNAFDVSIEQGSVTDLLYGNTSSLVKNRITGPNHFVTYSSEAWENDHIVENCFPSFKLDFCALLNHNFEGGRFYVGFKNADNSGEVNFGGNTLPFDYDKSLNISFGGNSLQEFNGFSIGVTQQTFNFHEYGRIYCYGGPRTNDEPYGDRYLGSLMIGKTWTPPHNPNLSMTVSKTFDGIRKTKTKGGHTISNINYLGNPDWAGHNAWELWNYPEDPLTIPPSESPDETEQPMLIEDSKLNLGRLGRRSWKLSFDFVSEKDVFGALEQSNILPFIPSDDFPSEYTQFSFQTLGYGTMWDNPMLFEDNFISRVWVPTLGGTIPMLIQLDHSHNRPDNYAIVTIKQNSFNVTPKAPNIYNFSMILEETW
tara:strand:+ start:31 stop:1215 length:1185 start_codon:yes stop_codon:yes gene_type:complete